MKINALTLFIFRRDLRLADNTALITALRTSQLVIPCFIFDPRQIAKNEYKSDNCIQFMVTSLQELHEQLQKRGSQLYCTYGLAEEVIEKLISDHAIDAIFINRDYSPFSRMRDEKIKSICQQTHVKFQSFDDALLHPPEVIKKSNHTPYSIFTPFLHRAMSLNVALPQKNYFNNYYHGPSPFKIPVRLSQLNIKKNPQLLIKGGRKEAKQLLKAMQTLNAYDTVRNFPAQIGTTHLSAHHKFGTISIRECYHILLNTFSEQHGLIKALYWRDFFTYILFHFPHVLGHAFRQKFENIKWSQHKRKFQQWCHGETGFPIVDAGMRELNTTGFMHNRVRMITASFLTKDLHIDWRWGEKYFAQQLIDYDPAVNNGNWQWAASTGCDAQPYFRIFNPWLQQEKFDPTCLYIKKWIPELKKYSAKNIHQLGKNIKNRLPNYPFPIVNHAVESQKTKSIYFNLSI